MSDDANTARTCVPCNLCCLLYRVSELNKPAGVWCGHCSDAGCLIHEDPSRLAICREFQCLWSSGDLAESARPDLIEAIFRMTTLGGGPSGGVDVAEVTEFRKGASLEEPVARLIEEFQDKGYGVQVVFNGQCMEMYAPVVGSSEEMEAYLDRLFIAINRMDRRETMGPAMKRRAGTPF